MSRVLNNSDGRSDEPRPSLTDPHMPPLAEHDISRVAQSSLVGEPEPAQQGPTNAVATDRDVAREPEPKGRSKQHNAKVGDLVANRYEIDGILGEGGMGIVYACTDQHTGARVALKQVIPPEGKLHADYITWFFKEARALAALDHPNIVQAHDFGQLEEGSPYLAMELVVGHSLHDLLTAGLSYPIIWSLVDQVLSALAHAHAHRVIHGDLKPSNVIVKEIPGGPPKAQILDFGLAWLKEDPHDERLDGAKAIVFLPHAGAGTPGYMAPEQIVHETHHIEGGTDLYALGCILYKLLSGRAPWTGRSRDLLKWHAYEKPPVVEPLMDVPDGVVPFVMRLLQKRPWQRFEFAAEGRRAWAELRPSEPVDPEDWDFPAIIRSSGPPPASEAGAALTEGGRLERVTGLLSIRPSPLVGRDDIRDVLLGACARVARGEGESHQLVLLLGPAGVGKTRIAEWLCSHVHEQALMVPLVARYRRVRGTLDGMLGAVMQHYNFENADRATIEKSLLSRWNVDPRDRRMRTWVAGAAEWLKPTSLGHEASVGPSGIRFTIDTLEVRRQVIRFVLRRIANGRPLLFFLDDLHNASSATIDGLLRIHSEETDQPIFMVATVRTEDIRLGAEVAKRLRELRDRLSGDVIEVNPMDRDTTCQMLSAVLPLELAAVSEAARRSRGFPLFALQQLHAWAHAGKMKFVNGQYEVARDVLAVRPKTTADLWESRLAALDTQYTEAALAMAPLGIDIRRTVITALFDALGIRAEAAILHLQKAELIVPRDQARYSWPHALLQEHLFRKLTRRSDSARFFSAAARALEHHPLANTRRIVRQRVVNLLYAGEAIQAASIFFGFLEQSWNGARQPAATLADLELFNGHLQGHLRATCDRWRAEALCHMGRSDEARKFVEEALAALLPQGAASEIAHCERLMGKLMSASGSPEGGLSQVRKAHATFSRVGDVQGMALCEGVAAEIEYLLGNYAGAEAEARRGELHFSALNHSMGRGGCLLLLSAVAQSEGAVNRSRRLTLEAQAEFERNGYRLGIAQTAASLAQLEYRLANFYNAFVGAQEALGMFDALHTLPGQADCERLLAMIGVDTHDPDVAQVHATRAALLYTQMGDPWGILESELLLAQIALALHLRDTALEHLARVSTTASSAGPEPRQHALLTRAWAELEFGDVTAAVNHLHAARDAFQAPWQVGDHTPHLLARLAGMQWPSAEAARVIDAWRREINDHARRDGQ